MHVFCFCKQVGFHLESQISSIEFLWQAQSILTICKYLSISNFVMLLNNGSYLEYTKMKSTISPDQWIQSVLDESDTLLFKKGGQFELACLFWPVICNMPGRLN